MTCTQKVSKNDLFLSKVRHGQTRGKSKDNKKDFSVFWFASRGLVLLLRHNLSVILILKFLQICSRLDQNAKMVR